MKHIKVLLFISALLLTSCAGMYRFANPSTPTGTRAGDITYNHKQDSLFKIKCESVRGQSDGYTYYHRMFYYKIY